MFYQGRHANYCRDGARTAHQGHGKGHECDVAFLRAAIKCNHRSTGGRAGKQLEANAQQNDAAHNANHGQRDTKYSQYERAEDKEEE